MMLHSLPARDGFHMPAEFAPQDGVMLVWPVRPEMVPALLVPQQVAGGLRYLACIGAVAPPPLGRAGGEALLPHDAAHGPLADPRIRPGPG